MAIRIPLAPATDYRSESRSISGTYSYKVTFITRPPVRHTTRVYEVSTPWYGRMLKAVGAWFTRQGHKTDKFTLVDVIR